MGALIWKVVLVSVNSALEGPSVLMHCALNNHRWPFSYHMASIFVFCPFYREKKLHKLGKVY